MDTSFARESIISIAKMYKTEKGFCLIDIESQDIIDNINCAAVQKEQPIIIWRDKNTYEFLGPKVTTVTKELIDLVITNGKITTSEISDKLNISSQNASTKIKNLYKKGYIFRYENTAESGGIEYI